MNRYIDADALIKDLKRQYMFLFGTDELPNGIQSVIKNFPTADVVEVKHGRWEYLYDGNYKCSECGSWWCCTDLQIDEMNFCPNCGADMRERREDDKE